MSKEHSPRSESLDLWGLSATGNSSSLTLRLSAIDGGPIKKLYQHRSADCEYSFGQDNYVLLWRYSYWPTGLRALSQDAYLQTGFRFSVLWETFRTVAGIGDLAIPVGPGTVELRYMRRNRK